MKKIIFTDLDGTLLDDSYSYKKAKATLDVIKKKRIPLIFCSSKTRAEIEIYRREIGNKDPFISENGGAIFIPKNYFNFRFRYNRKDKKYFIIRLGTEHRKLVSVLKKIKKMYKIKGFSEMSIKELAKESGLPLKQARVAKKREFDEAFKIIDVRYVKNILKCIKENKLNYTVGGKYHHIMDNNDKGKAVKILSKLFKRQYGKIVTIGIGNSENDFKMLDKVDKAYLVMNKNKKYASRQYKRAKGIGPAGWNKTVKEVLND